MDFSWLSAALGSAVGIISGLAIQDAWNRAGKIEFEAQRVGFYCLTETVDGRKLLARYSPHDLFLEKSLLPMVIQGSLTNTSNTTVVLKEPTVQFEHPVDGVRMIHRGFKMLCNTKETNVISIPSNGVCQILISLDLARSDLERTYRQAIPYLAAIKGERMKVRIRLKSRSFYGDPPAIWSRRKKRLVFGRPLEEQNLENDGSIYK